MYVEAKMAFKWSQKLPYDALTTPGLHPAIKYVVVPPKRHLFHKCISHFEVTRQ